MSVSVYMHSRNGWECPFLCALSSLNNPLSSQNFVHTKDEKKDSKAIHFEKDAKFCAYKG